jgi:hypothetical protein
MFSDISRKRGISEGMGTGRVVENSRAVYGQRTLSNDAEAQENTGAMRVVAAEI